MNRDLRNTIIFVRKFLLKYYNHFIIDINDSFIGCKFYKGQYYIFFISIYENKITFTYRMDFTEKEVIRLLIDDFDDASLAVFISQVMNAALNKNEALISKMKLLPHSLVNYRYKEDTNETRQNKDEEPIETKYNEIEELELPEKVEEQPEEIEILEMESEAINKDITQEELGLSLENINMSNRLRNCMMNNNIRTVGEFLKLDLEKIKDIRNLGEKSAKEAAYLVVALKNNLKEFILDIPSKKVKEIESELESNIKEELLEALYSKISVDECDFSVRLLNCLKQNNILTIKDLILYPNQDLKLLDKLGKKSYEEAIEFKNNIFLENQFDKESLDFLKRVIKTLTKENEISTIYLKNFLANNSDYPTDNLINDLNSLRSNEIIIYTMNGIKFKRKSLLEVAEGLDDENKKLFLSRLEGKTLQELGDERGLTRERIRQKLARIYENIPEVEEDKYKSIFEEYNFESDEFTTIFEEEKYVFGYLKEKYNSGDKDISEGIETSRFTEKQKEAIRGLRKIVKIFDETIFLNKYNVIRTLVKQYAKKNIETEKFTNIYNEFISSNNYNLSKSDDRTMEGTLTRIGDVVFGLGRRFRYYDYKSISQEDYDCLKEILLNLESGFYSTLVICNNYKELISSLDIKDEYELHNLCKNLFSKLTNITFDRMPHFSINGITKDEFIEEKIKELAPVSLNDFGEIMEEEYGHKSATVTWHITNNFQQYIENGVLKNNIISLSDEVVDNIKKILIKPIYSLEEVKEILRNNGYNNINEIVNTANMYKIGYRIRSSYICKKEITSMEDYFRQIAEENDFIQNENILKNSTYSAMMKRIEKTLDIFLISNDEYITLKKLKKLGIEKEDIVDFCNEVKNIFKDKTYFTLSNVRDLIEINKLDDFGFDNIFLENIIGNIDDVTYTKFSGNKIFTFVDNKIESEHFVLDCIGNVSSITIDELQNKIEEEYGIQVTQDKIKNAIIDTDLYISDMLNKIYQNKEIYYEEVYEHE